jgi:acyl carrier protein
VCVDGPARGLQFVQAILAFAEGSELVIVPAATEAPGLSTLLSEEKGGLLHASGATWKKLLAARGGQSLPIIALLDVTDATTDLVGALIEAGATVVALHRPSVFAVPVAAGILTDARETSLIGQPLLVNGVKLLDVQGRSVPPGIPAELQVDGAAGRVATGLLARWRQDGVLQYVGQVGATAFVDGCRIDIGALERALRSVPGVADAGVTVLEDAVAYRRLAACVQASGAAELAACGDVMSQLLPRGVDAAISAVDRIVRLTDGTLDPKLFASRGDTTVSRSGPSLGTPTQQALAEVWQELLGVAPGPQDNFFDLGGTSLMAMNAVVKLEQRIGKQISPRRYVTETLAQIAAAYDNAGTVAEETVVTKVEPAQGGGFMKRLAKLIRRA